MDFFKRCWAEIDLDALDFNMKSIKEKCQNEDIIAVVKANAYGHSDKICAEEFYRLGIRRFAVSNIHEAEIIRRIINDDRCFLLVFGYIPEENFDAIIKYNLTITVGSVEFAEKINRFALSKNHRIKVNIGLDTGMTRVGVSTNKEIDQIVNMPMLDITGIYSHLAVGDSLEKSDMEYTQKQYEKISELTKGRNIPVHFQNSGGIEFHSDMKFDYVRPGIIQYGLSPNTSVKDTIPLRQVMKLKSVIDQLKIVPENTDIGYGRTYTTASERIIALIPAGYADGYSRALSNKGKVIVNGCVCSIVGRICMDQFMADVTDANAKVGDEVTLYSGEYRETDLGFIADSLGTISYELVCNVSSRIPRVAMRDGKAVRVVNER